MQEQRLQANEESAGEVRVGSRELVEAISAIESRQAHSPEMHDTIALGDAVEQLGLTMSAEELLAEIRSRQAHAQGLSTAAHTKQKKRNVLAIVLIVSIALNLYLLARPGVGSWSESRPLPVAAATGFARIKQLLESNQFDGGKLSFLRAAARTNSFTSSQARELLAAFDFDADRATAAVVLYPRITDRENFLTVLDTFQFDSGRTDVLNRLNLQ